MLLRKAQAYYKPLMLGKAMYNGGTKKDYVQAALVAGLGAGVATSFAVSQGQNPLLALAITVMASIFAVVCHRYDLV